MRLISTSKVKGSAIPESNKNYYSINISDIVDELIINEKKIKHINFTKLHQNNKIYIDKKFFEPDDPASHLKEEYHANFFLEKILKNIE